MLNLQSTMKEWSIGVPTMPNIPISCLPPSSVDPKVQGLKVIITWPQRCSSWVTHRPPSVSRWTKCCSNDTMMALHGSGMSKVPKEMQLEWLEPTRRCWAGDDARTVSFGNRDVLWML